MPRRFHISLTKIGKMINIGLLNCIQQPKGGLDVKTIAVLFTQNQGWFAALLKRLFGQKYDHVSISLGSHSEFYSFNFKGFAHETPEKFRRHQVVSSTLYELPVADTAYHTLQRKLETIRQHRSEMRYSFPGVVFCCLGIPFRWAKHYFCSQFVTELLKSANAVKLRKRACLYLPEQLRRELDGCAGVRRLADVV